MEAKHTLTTGTRLLTQVSAIILLLASVFMQETSAQNAVGSVNGALTVNDMGAAVYSMTFDAPNGGRMTPKIGLAYSSQSSGYGLAGYGIDVTGISVITSGGRDMFHNGKGRGANYDKDSNFYLDGKRLVLQEGEDSEGGAVYSPEGDPYTKVTFFYGVDYCGASYFSVRTNDGTTYTYGQTGNSKLRTSVRGYDRVAAWYICEARNKYGESIQYKYTGGLRLVPSEITYGNGTERGISAKIEFTYTTMASGNERPFHIGNWKGTNSTLLSSVTTSINGQTYRKYDFTYDETASDKFSRLTTITESNGAGESLNPTELTWNVRNDMGDVVCSDNEDIAQRYYDGVHKDVGENNFLAVDLNGDGIAEIVRICQGNMDSYYGRSNHIFIHIQEGYIDNDGNLRYRINGRLMLPFFPINYGDEDGNDYIRYILGGTTVLDVDGDGLNDLVFPCFKNQNGNKSEKLYIIYGKDVRDNNTVNYSTEYFPNVSFPVIRGEGKSLLVGHDLNGDGRDDIISLEEKGDNGKYNLTLARCFGPDEELPTTTPITYKDITLQSVPKRLFAGDYNNDGLADLIVVCENGYKVFFNNGDEGGPNIIDVFTDENSYTSTYSNSPFYTGIKNCWRMEQGDFDGDGLLDFFYHDTETTSLGIAYNNGDGTFRKTRLQNHFDIYELTDREDDNDKFAVHVMDFDRDGRSDVFISKFNVSETRLRWLRSTGNDLELFRSYAYYSKDEAKERYIFTGDFDGDGQIELANVGFYLNANQKFGSENTIHIYKVGDRDASLGKVSTIKDGYGNITNVSYEYATNPEIYTNGESAYPVNSYTMPVALVSNVTSDNMNLSYRYGGMKMHIAGRGIMGFSMVETHNNKLETVTCKEVTRWNPTWWIPIETKTISKFSDPKYWQTYTSTSSFTIENVGNNNYFTYLSCVSNRDFDDISSYKTIKCDVNNGTLTAESQNQYDENYRNHIVDKYATEYVLKGGQWLPTHKYTVTRHPDDENTDIVSKDYEYDSKGNVTSVTSGGSSMYLGSQYIDGLYHRTDYTYDRWGNVTSETFHGNDESTGYKYYEYDRTGRFLVKTYTVPESTTTSYTYDVFGNVLTETDETNPSNPLTTIHTYDSWGRRIRTVNPDGTETIYYTEWDNDDNIGDWFSEERHTGAPWTRVTYDSHGREIATTTVGPNYINVEKNTEYNEKGQVSKITNIYGKRTTTETFTYDARGRVLTDTHSSGASTTYEYGRNTVSVKDAAGRTTTKSYDPWGNVKTVTDNEGNIVEYQYGSHGNPVNVTMGDATVTMEYDELGRRTKLVDPDAGTVTTTYGRNGQVISETDGRGVKTTYTYDALGRVTQRKREDTTNKWADPSITSYTYGTSGNSKGRIVKKDCDGKAVSYEYDMYGRVTRESRGMAYNHDYTYDELRKTYTYDSYGRLATVTYPASHSSKGITIGYRYDSNGNVTKVLFDNRLDNCLSRNYSDDGLRREIRSDYLGKTVIDYDNDGYPVSKSYEYINSKNNRGISDALSFSWDKTTGNLLGKTTNGKTETYSYDNLDRLTGVSCNGVETMTMCFADNGNIISKTGIGEYTYYDGDRPHAVREVENVDGIIDNREVSTQYALNGKVTSIWNKDYTAYSWYEYGPDDEKWSSWGWTPDDMGLEWDVDRVYWGDYERLTKDYHIREYYFLDNDVFFMRDNPDADSDDTGIWHEDFYQMERDNIGNIVAIYDLLHRKVFEAEYDAWGKQTVIKDDICFNHGFTGHEMLPQFGLIHMDGRVYDPAIGRFLSPDNYVQMPESSQSFNRYSYCINNPLKYTDPTGQLFGIDDAVLAFAFASLVQNVAIAAFNGESIWKAAGISILSSAASYGIGSIFGATGNFGHELLRAGAHGLASGVTSALSGENFGRGFVSGAVSSGIGSFASGVDMNDGLMLASCAAAGGLTEWALGGDFLQGAMNGLTIGAMNHLQHEPQGLTEEEIEKIAEAYPSYEEYKYADEFYQSLGGFIAEDAAAHPEWYKYTCAARLSQALNESGVLPIPNIKGKTFAGAGGRYYFMQAKQMSNWLRRKLGNPKLFTYSSKKQLPNSIIFQEGFRDATGHVDVVFNGRSGGTAVTNYNDNKNKLKYYLWRAR